MKRPASLLLAMLMIASLLSACSNGNTETTTDTTATDVVTAPVETETELTHGLTGYDFGGESYVSLVRTEKLHHFTAEEYTGEALNDAVYNRNTLVTEEFNVALSFVDVVSDRTTFNNTISTSILAQDQAYDLIVPDYW